jgi:hypothetical protein
MKILRLLLPLWVVFLIPKSSIGQFLIKVKSTHTVDSVAYLRGVIFDDKNFIPKDTLELYKGLNIVKNTKPIVGGIYYLYFPKSKQKIYLPIENKDTIAISIADSNYLHTVNTNNKIITKFISYQLLEQSFFSLDSIYEAQVKQGKKFNLVQKAAYFKTKTDQLVVARKEIMKSLQSDKALYVYLDALNKLDASVPSRKNFAGRVDFLSSMDINAPKMLFTPNLKPLFTEFLSYYPLVADSIVKGVDSIMLKLDCKSKAYPYVFDYFVKLLKNREIQNNTKAYAYFIKKYVKENKCKFLDPKIEKELLDDYQKVSALQSQDTSVNMILKDTLGIEQNLHTFAKQFDYTLITFFDPTCEHCQVELPRMDSVVDLIEKQLVLKIGKFTVYNDVVLQMEVWKKFVLDLQLTKNYTHVHLGNNNEIRKAYDAFTNPIFYLIDKEGKLIGKKISTNTLRKILIGHIQTGK